MRHIQILRKITSKGKLYKKLVETIEKDVAILIIFSDGDIRALFNRWNCTLLSTKDLGVYKYKELVYLILVVTLHKHGIKDNDFTQKALIAIDELNKEEILGKAFNKQIPSIKELLETVPVKPTKKPPFPDAVTFFREGDIIAIEIKSKFFVAYVHNVGFNETPLIEFYDTVFDKLPKIKQLKNAKGAGDEQIARFYVYGMKHQHGMRVKHDFANQIYLIDVNNTNNKPINSHLEKHIGLGQRSDIFTIQKDINRIFFGSYEVL